MSCIWMCTYSTNTIYDWRLLFYVLVLQSSLFRDQSPQLFQVNRWAVVLVSVQVEISHTNFTEVTWMAEICNIDVTLVNLNLCYDVGKLLMVATECVHIKYFPKMVHTVSLGLFTSSH